MARTILIVDDSVTMRQMVSFTLREAKLSQERTGFEKKLAKRWLLLRTEIGCR